MQADSPDVIKKWDKIGVALFLFHTIMRTQKNAVIRLLQHLETDRSTVQLPYREV